MAHRRETGQVSDIPVTSTEQTTEQPPRRHSRAAMRSKGFRMVSGMVIAALSLSFLSQVDPGTAQGRLQGHVVDASGGAIAATLRVSQGDTNAVLRFRADENGLFRVGSLLPGQYSVTVFSPGFRRREVRNVVIEAWQTSDLGEIPLDFSGCDTPGTNCDYFGEAPNYAKGIIAEAHVTLRLPCAVNLGRKGATVCPKGGGAVRARNADIRLAEENAALYLVTANGAAMSDLYASTADCSGVTYRNAPHRSCRTRARG